MITAVLFDAGNTLVEPDYELVARIFGDEGVETTGTALREAAGRSRPELDRALRSRGQSTESRDARALYLGLVFERVGVSDDATRRSIVERLLPIFPDLWSRPMPGLEETLPALRAAGYRLGVVSNSDGSVAAGFESSGLAEHFEAVVDSGIEGVEKPDPEIFRIALERVGASPEEAVFVGDMPSVDVEGARASGIAPILIDPYDAFPDLGVPRIRALPELPRLLAELSGRDQPGGRMSGLR